MSLKHQNTAPSEKDVRLAGDFVSRVANKKVNSAMSVSNNLKLKLRASRSATKLYHRCCSSVNPSQANQSIRSQEDDGQPMREDLLKPLSKTTPECSIIGESISDFSGSSPNLENESFFDPKNRVLGHLQGHNDPKNVVVTGFDVEALYPSLRDIDVACLVRESVIHSNINELMIGRVSSTAPVDAHPTDGVPRGW